MNPSKKTGKHSTRVFRHSATSLPMHMHLFTLGLLLRIANSLSHCKCMPLDSTKNRNLSRAKNSDQTIQRRFWVWVIFAEFVRHDWQTLTTVCFPGQYTMSADDCEMWFHSAEFGLIVQGPSTVSWSGDSFLQARSCARVQPVVFHAHPKIDP